MHRIEGLDRIELNPVAVVKRCAEYVLYNAAVPPALIIKYLRVRQENRPGLPVVRHHDLIEIEGRLCLLA